ncbi:MAG: LysR family transcriptional regulator, partial [Syntrophobacteraceae bacterium CG2_30_61_12]
MEIFCRVLELKSFTKAAEAVYLSQPTISEHVRTLEELLGEKLIDRLGKEVLPTPAGRILYQYALKILQLREEAIQAIARYRGDLSGKLVLGASTIPGTYVLPKWIGSFKADHPDIQISLQIGSTGSVVESVLNGELEFGMVGSRWEDRRLQLEALFSDELVLAVYAGHPWAELTEVPMSALYGEPFIMRRRGSGTRMVMSEILGAHGFDFSRLTVVAEVAGTEVVRESIKARIGVSILSRQAVADDIRHGVLQAVPIQGIRFGRPFYLVRRAGRELSPVSSAFLEHLRGGARG